MKKIVLWVSLALLIMSCDTSRITTGSRPSQLTLAEAGKELPVVVLYTEVLNGIGDAVHLEEYMKYLKNHYSGRLQAIGLAQFSSFPQGRDRAERLKEFYRFLDIRAYNEEDAPSLGFEGEYIIPEAERLRIAGTFVISTGAEYPFSGSRPKQIVHDPRGFLEYAANGFYRFYMKPGVIEPAKQTEFWAELQSDSPQFHALLLDAQKSGRPLLPGDLRFEAAVLCYINTFAPLYPNADFYLPRNQLTDAVREQIRAHYPKAVFVSPDSPTETTPPESIRIFYGFPLSDDSYKGLFLYTQGDVVGYGGDDGFTLALSSAKLPFPGVTSQSHQSRILTDHVPASLLHDYFLQAMASFGDPAKVSTGLDKSKEEILALKAEWLAYADHAYVHKNAFTEFDRFLQQIIAGA